MTKYVLNSGGAKRYPELKKKFHLELIKDLGKRPKFLFCNFAQGREYWEEKFPEYCAALAEDMPEGVKPSFNMAMPETFQAQSLRADVLYFHGGDDHLLQYWMRKFDLTKLFRNKVVATSSASSAMLSAHYWGCDWRKCDDGFGILPIKVIPHYMSDFGSTDPRGPIDWQKAYNELSKFGDTTLPIHALKEGEFIVIEK